VSEFTGSHAAAERVADPSGPAQHRTTELPGVCGEVNYLTGPRLTQCLKCASFEAFCSLDSRGSRIP